MSRKKGRRLNKKIEDSEENFVPKAFRKDKSKENVKAEERSKAEKIEKKSKKKISQNNKGLHINFKIKRVIFSLIILVIIIIGILIAVSTHQWKKLAQEMIGNQNSIVKDVDGNVIAKLGSEKKNNNISIEKMPNNLKNAYIAIEDERFYKHHGVDIKRTSSAIFSYVIHFGSSSFGGSTITQQLVKNLTGDSTDSITRKVNEWWKAWQLETCLDKNQVLEAYLNIIYVGPNIYGVDAGAKYYFNKSAENLSLEECAFLAGINHSPNAYNPFEETNNSEKINKRTKTVLAKMLELKYIDQKDYDNAISNVENGLKFKKGVLDSGNGVYSYHTDALITEITKDISKKYNISSTFANNYMNMAGLTINSTQDSNVQSKVESEFNKNKYILASKNGSDTSQAAMVIIDNKTGYVSACAGGLGKKTEARSLNRATQSIRQTGSAIKPIAVLAPAIEKKIITASSVFDDTQREFENGYTPDDYSNQLGKITVRRAVESSQNIPFVEIMEKLKPKFSIKYLEKMGVSTLTKEDNNLVLSLGGLEKGISPLEMAGAYATIANDGVYREPTFYSKIINNSGKTIIVSKQKTRRVFSKEVAYIVKDLLTQPVKGSNGTATYCAISGMDVAAKTGTTDENYDRWLCGFTTYYTAATWFGFDQNESIDYYNKNPAGLIWANVMNSVHSGLKGTRFEKPTAIKTVTVCSKTGMKANTGCPNTYDEYFLWWTEPGNCSEHSGKDLSSDSNTNTKSNKSQTTEIKGPTLEEEEKINNTTNNSTNSNSNVKNNTTTKNNTINRTNTTDTTNQINKNETPSNSSTNNTQNNTISGNTTNTTNSTNTTNVNSTNSSTE